MAADPLRREWSCDLCGETAGAIELVADDEVRRTSFTGLMIRPGGAAALREPLLAADAAALHAADLELVPWWCPQCRASYCGDHWRWWDVFDEGFHDEIRGICPEGHERMLED